MELTQAEAIRLFDYNQETGIVTRNVSIGRNGKKGRVVGCINGRGYLRVSHDYRSYLLHRVIWLISHGEFPKGQIDHINQDKLDNRLSNLRDVSNIENCRNKGISRKNTSGFTGVYFDKTISRWNAAINTGVPGGRQIILGKFINKEEAIEARRLGEIKYGYHKNHGAAPGRSQLNKII